MVKFNHNPCESTRITAKFGYNNDYLNDNFHNGLDIGPLIPGVEGDSIYAVNDGIIRFIKLGSPSAGNYAVLECKDYTIRYLHMQSITAKIMEVIKAGEIIGYMGSTGICTGPHLHIEVKTCKFDDKDYWLKNSDGKYIKAINPEDLLLKEHWAEKHWISLNEKGIKINEKRFDDPMTRGEVFALLDRAVHN